MLFVNILLINFEVERRIVDRDRVSLVAGKSITQRIDPFCEVPLSSGGFKGWRDGVVTALKPVVERNCSRILTGDKKEILDVRARNKAWKNSLTDKKLLEASQNCSWVKEYFQDNLYMTKLERSFPIAYTFVVYNSPQQVLRLLKLFYRPMNSYCIHPDKKSTPAFKNLFSNLAACLENIIIPQTVVKVTWGLSTILSAQMSCLKDLMKFRSRQPEQGKWKYVINLCGKELPLMSTHSIVSHLIKLNGTSAITASRVSPRDRKTFRKRLRRRKMPHNLPLYKSMTYLALSSNFSHYLLTNSTAIELYKFFTRCHHSEEHFYATLFMIPGVPGGYKKIPKDLHFEVMNCIWLHAKHPRCAGLNVHSVCVVGVGDLENVMKTSQQAIFHNKYFMDVDHTIMDCMEERLVVENKVDFQKDCNITTAAVL